MKTLVIHPKDSTTDFLSLIYSNKPDWTIITDHKVSKKVLKKEIASHDRVIFLGHGTEEGLICPIENSYSVRWIIDSTYVYLLRDKECVYIWCNADVFVKKYGLKGFYSGMIISEYEEAIHYCLHDFYSSNIDESNILFSRAIFENIEANNMLAGVKSIYTAEKNPIIDFNQQNLYITENSLFNKQ
jgi:hypothetical protein